MLDPRHLDKTNKIPVPGALLEYAAILLLLKKKRMPLRKLEKTQNGHKIENITAAGALPSDNLRRKSLTNGDFDKTLDLEVRNIKLFQIFFVTKYFCVCQARDDGSTGGCGSGSGDTQLSKSATPHRKIFQCQQLFLPHVHIFYA